MVEGTESVGTVVCALELGKAEETLMVGSPVHTVSGDAVHSLSAGGDSRTVGGVGVAHAVGGYRVMHSWDRQCVHSQWGRWHEHIQHSWWCTQSEWSLVLAQSAGTELCTVVGSVVCAQSVGSVA